MYFDQHYYGLFRRAFFYFSDYNKNKMQIYIFFLVNVAIIEGLNSMVTFWGPTIWFLKGVGVGGGLYGWFGLGKIFFLPRPLEFESFSWHTTV